MGELTHDVELMIEGPLVTLMSISEEEVGDVPENCESSISYDVLMLKCEGMTHAELADSEDGFAFDIRVVQTETDDGTEYWVSMPYPFEDLDTSINEEEDSFDIGLEADDIFDLSFSWDVKVPGEIVQERSNADSYRGSTASFESTLGEERPGFEVVSLVRPGSGGACSAP